MKRFAAFFLSALLVLSVWVVQAEETQWCYYKAPDGVQLFPLHEFGTQLAPEGLEAMYASLTDANDDSNVHIFRMPNGRALVSVACYTDPNHGTVQELYDNWDAVAASLGQDALSFNRDISCVTIEQKYGYDALCINTEMVPAADPSLTLVMEGIVLYDGIDMMETWAIYPVEKAASNIPLLQSDLSALRELQASFEFAGEKADAGPSPSPNTLIPEDIPSDWTDTLHDFAATPAPEGVTATPSAPDYLDIVFNSINSGDGSDNNNSDLTLFLQSTPEPIPEYPPEPAPTETAAPGGLFFAPIATPVPEAVDRPDFETASMQTAWQYTDPNGHFTIWLPEGTTVLTGSSSADEFSAERQRWANSHSDGAELFDLFCDDIDSYQLTLFSHPDYGMVIRLSKENEPYFKDYTVEDYLAQTETVRENMAQLFGAAEILPASESSATFNDLEHAAFPYCLRHNDRPITAILFAATDKEGCLREIDLFSVLAGEDGLPDFLTGQLYEEIINNMKYLYAE